MITAFFLPAFEKALNRYLALDPEAKKRLQGLEGKIISLELAPLKQSFQLSIAAETIHLHSGNSLPAEITIRGTPLTLLSLALSKDKKHLFKGKVAIEGDAELGQQLVDLFDQLDIDWEEYLAKSIGDLPAHQLGRLGKKLFAFGKEASTSLLQNVNDYVHEEKPWFPPAEALADFFHEVDELRLATDRLEARVQCLLK